MKIRVLGAAGRDLIEGHRFYEKQAAGAGDYFLASLYSVRLALVARGEADFTYAGLASQTSLALSAVHGSLKRAEVARLLIFAAHHVRRGPRGRSCQS